MKTLSIFFAVCVGLTCASMRLPTDWDFLKPLAKNIAVNSVREMTGIDLTKFSDHLNRFNQLRSEAAKDSFLTGLGGAFAAKFGQGEFLKGKSTGDIITAFKDNVKQLFSNPIDPNWTPALDNEVMGLNQAEFQGILGTHPENRTNSVSSTRRRRQVSSLPKSVDWRTRGAVTPVKNQGKCGSCWAFAAVGALEGRLGVMTGQAPVLSEQNLVDCAKEVNGTKCCQGCDGGWMTEGYSYVQINDGIASTSSYPYEAADKQCRYDAKNKAGHVIGFEYTEQDSEVALQRAVAEEGPVAVAVDANGWSSYRSGVYRCRGFITGMISPLKINHGVVVVGYGTSLFEGDYWIVKNSWGDKWGEKGYIKIARNAGNQCGIASQANYPLVAER